MLILLFKNVLKISNFENGTKTSKNLKKTAKKNFKFFFVYALLMGGGKNFINKNCLFDAKFFEFEEFTIAPFFCSSIQPQHTVQNNQLKSADIGHEFCVLTKTKHVGHDSHSIFVPEFEFDHSI